MYHGECVSIGAAAAAYISMKRGYLTKDELQTVLDAFTSFKLPITVTGVDKEAALAATKSDKKMQGNQIRFILLSLLERPLLIRLLQWMRCARHLTLCVRMREVST